MLPLTRCSITRSIRASGWQADIRPTFRPDAVVNLLRTGWRSNIDALSQVSGSLCQLLRKLYPGPGGQARLLQVAGGDGHRPVCRIGVYGRAELSLEAEAIFQRALARPGHGRGCSPLHRAHAHGERADEHRGWPGDAVPRRLRSATTTSSYFDRFGARHGR